MNDNVLLFAALAVGAFVLVKALTPPPPPPPDYIGGAIKALPAILAAL